MGNASLDIDHYQHIYTEYAPMLMRFAEKFVSGFFAEDIVHDVFLKLWDKQVFRLPESDLKRVLYVSVRNACLDYLRRMNMEQEIIDHRALQLKLDELDFFEASDELFMRKDLLDLLMKKVAELPERSQEVFRMSYLEGLKAAEIAERLNLSVRTVENLLYRSLLYLRKNCSNLFLLIFFYKGFVGLFLSSSFPTNRYLAACRQLSAGLPTIVGRRRDAGKSSAASELSGRSAGI